MDVEQEPTPTYQQTLRALGAFLDREPVCHISLVEVVDGFMARYYQHLSDPEPTLLHFQRETLGTQLSKLALLREQSSQPDTRYEGLWARFPKGHQDFFRALGYELDQQGARWILIDELEDSLVVTYRHPGDGTDGWRKRVVVMSADEIDKVLRAAVERRRILEPET